MEPTDPSPVAAPVFVPSWPSEAALLAAVVLVSVGLWLLLAVTLIGLAYALLIALFLFFSHVVFVAHVRGSAVRLGASQFPELWRRVADLAARAGLAAPPECCLMESGGALNALATKRFRGRLVVLFTPLVEACGEDRAAPTRWRPRGRAHSPENRCRWIPSTASPPRSPRCRRAAWFWSAAAPTASPLRTTTWSSRSSPTRRRIPERRPETAAGARHRSEVGARGGPAGRPE